MGPDRGNEGSTLLGEHTASLPWTWLLSPGIKEHIAFETTVEESLLGKRRVGIKPFFAPGGSRPVLCQGGCARGSVSRPGPVAAGDVAPCPLAAESPGAGARYADLGLAAVKWPGGAGPGAAGHRWYRPPAAVPVPASGPAVRGRPRSAAVLT